MVCSCCHCAAPYLNVTWSPLPTCACPSQGAGDLGNLSPAHSSSWGKPTAWSSPWYIREQNAPTVPIEATQHSSCCQFFFFNYAIIKKNSQTKINAFVIRKWLQRIFYTSFSFQSWHVLQSNSHFAQLHSLILFIRAVQTINNYF